MQKGLLLLSYFIFCLTLSTLALTPEQYTKQSQVEQLIAVANAFKTSNSAKALKAIDSALTIANQLHFNSGIADAYLKKGDLLYNSADFKASNVAYKQALEILTQMGNKKQVARCLKEISGNYIALGEFKKATEQLEQTKKIATEINDQDLVAECTLSSGILLMNIGRYADAVVLFFDALKTAEQQKNNELINKCYIQLGVAYSFQGNITQSNQYFQKAVEIYSRNGNKLGLADLYCNLGSNYLSLGNNQKALEYMDKSITLSKQLGYKNTIALNKLNIGYVLVNLNYPDKALSSFQESLTLFCELNDKKGIADANTGLGYYWVSRKDYPKGIEYYNASLIKAKELKTDYQLKANYEGLAYAFEKLGEFQVALKYRNLAQRTDNEVSNAESSKSMTQMQMTYDFDKKQEQQKIEHQWQLSLKESELKHTKFIWVATLLVAFLVLIIAGILFYAWKDKREVNKELADKNRIIAAEKRRSDELLLNILPAELATEMKQFGKTKSRNHDLVSVMVVDIKDFTKMEDLFTPGELVDELDLLFRTFDGIISKYKIEKIKTIGDAYLCASGLNPEVECTPQDVVRAAWDIQLFMQQLRRQREAEGGNYFEVKIGIHSGPLIAGIVGIRKFSFDIWGDTVKVAFSMEEKGAAGRINISKTTFELVKDTFYCDLRNNAVNGSEMYFVEGLKEEHSSIEIPELITDEFLLQLQDDLV